MQQVIILEGPDGGGKSTVADRLVADQRFRKIHTGPPKPYGDLFQEYAQALFQATTGSIVYPKPHVVFDRYHIGECVYGPIFRGVDQLGYRGLTLLERIISGLGAQVVIFLPPYDVCWKNVRERGDDLVKDESKFRAVWEHYAAFARTNQVYDYTKGEFEHPEVLLPLPEGFIGSPTPRFLFIGEVANHPSLDLPFMSRTGSSAYLFDCMKQAGFREEDTAFVNAYNLDGKVNKLYEGWVELGHPKVVTLGARAFSTFTRQGWAEGSKSARPLTFPMAVEHPAYWKRFRANEQSAYVAKLRKVLE